MIYSGSNSGIPEGLEYAVHNHGANAYKFVEEMNTVPVKLI